jgi:hypothetical protein
MTETVMRQRTSGSGLPAKRGPDSLHFSAISAVSCSSAFHLPHCGSAEQFLSPLQIIWG